MLFDLIDSPPAINGSSLFCPGSPERDGDIVGQS